MSMLINCNNKKNISWNCYIKNVLAGLFIFLSPIFLYAIIKWDILKENTPFPESDAGLISIMIICSMGWTIFGIFFLYRKKVESLKKLIKSDAANKKLTKEEISKFSLDELRELKIIIENFEEGWVLVKTSRIIDHNIGAIEDYISQIEYEHFEKHSD